MKKCCSFVFTVIIGISLLLLPVSAETPAGLSGNVVTSIDYRTESPLDITGNLKLENGDPESITYFDKDGIVCVNNDSIDQSHGFRMMYTENNYQVLDEVFTIELYVYMNEETYGMPIEFWWGGEEPAFGMLIWDGYRFGFVQSEEGEPGKGVLEDEDRIIEDGWYHVAVTSDGTTMNIYVNGELAGSGPHTKGGMHGLWYYWVAKTDYPAYGIAYLTIYNKAASAEQVKMMADPDYVPTTSDSGETTTPSATSDSGESTTPSATSNATPIPTKIPTQSNTETFDMGIISLAAVAFSSLAAMKKRKSRT